MPLVARNSRCDEIRLSSHISMRIHVGPGRDVAVDAEQLLGRHREDELVEQRRGVVHAGDVGQALDVGEVLGRLLHAGVEVADDRLGPQHGLALELEHEAEHAVRARVLGPHVDDHRLVGLTDPRRSARPPRPPTAGSTLPTSRSSSLAVIPLRGMSSWTPSPVSAACPDALPRSRYRASVARHCHARSVRRALSEPASRRRAFQRRPAGRSAGGERGRRKGRVRLAPTRRAIQRALVTPLNCTGILPWE